MYNIYCDVLRTICVVYVREDRILICILDCIVSTLHSIVHYPEIVTFTYRNPSTYVSFTNSCIYTIDTALGTPFTVV